ncbi:isochorismate synthase [Corynebacterium glucuronolyticum]|uniref:isochorismate synthase n=1 Tax=Corynebacterium glucuronolyticum TaxID=39791 RepID=A0A7T4EEH7_9CORY|nr:isochorismate synthase [Corynebacterium glucuronolyticum]QQB45898.1 isochorismate synthase [Corynebacterium glucuronolyticum]QRP71591.1 isochorismate synthase [Corynebacterium glucuronolyticum]
MRPSRPSRPHTAPDFLLSRVHGSVRTQGRAAFYTSVDEAIAALPTAGLIVGALPFDPSAPAALTVPKSVIWEETSLHPHPYYLTGEGSTLKAHIAGFDPSPEEHLARVTAAVEALKRGNLDKVVLARAVDIAFDEPVDPRLVAARLIATSSSHDGFIVDLGGSWLVGCSPEVLVRKQGAEVTCYPLAGTAPRSADPVEDQAAANRLLASAKDLAEHRFVVDDIRASLEPLTSSLTIPDTPELTSTNEVWHLATPIRGKLSDPTLTALDLARAVHPTPAICGTPEEAARQMILDVESDRHFYAGTVGWADAKGNGEFMVAIRCAEVSEDGTRGRAWAGGGIVAQSDPQQELEETTAKLGTILRALGL